MMATSVEPRYIELWHFKLLLILNRLDIHPKICCINRASRAELNYSLNRTIVFFPFKFDTFDKFDCTAQIDRERKGIKVLRLVFFQTFSFGSILSCSSHTSGNNKYTQCQKKERHSGTTVAACAWQKLGLFPLNLAIRPIRKVSKCINNGSGSK